ncbi:MAG: DUF1016 N-terminal domain-containing protein [Planctomycetaceae bacterium]|jgi:hypothetical protein|nr:DUF1016 N-terminal domain-containing protein [Planctomycetaceae bacterium]
MKPKNTTTNKKSALATKDYVNLISGIKERIRNAQIKSALSVNSELIMLYWDMARKIVEAYNTSSWGDGVLQQISNDLRKSFPEMKGFSVSNLRYIRQWYLYWNNNTINQQHTVKLSKNQIHHQVGGELPALLDKNQIHHQVGGELPALLGKNQIHHQVGGELPALLDKNQIHHQVGGELPGINHVRNANNFQPQYFDFFNRQGSCRNRNNYPKHIQIRERIT